MHTPIETLDDWLEIVRGKMPLPTEEAEAFLSELRGLRRALAGEDLPTLLADARRWRALQEDLAAPRSYEGQQPRISTHALNQYRRHYPEATRAEALEDLADGVHISRELVATLTSNVRRGGGENTYLASRERRGVWVLVEEQGRQQVITYLRMGPRQRRFLLASWPISSASGAA